MERLAIISRTELARRTRQMVDRVRRGENLIVKSYGEEQVVLMDVLDYRIMRAVMACLYQASRSSSMIEPAGLSEADLTEVDTQTRWNRLIAAYLDGQISLDQVASRLDVSQYDLKERFRRMEIPRTLETEEVQKNLTDTEPAFQDKSKDFFALAGLWQDRDISLETIRQKAWPRQRS